MASQLSIVHLIVYYVVEMNNEIVYECLMYAVRKGEFRPFLIIVFILLWKQSALLHDSVMSPRHKQQIIITNRDCYLN